MNMKQRAYITKRIQPMRDQIATAIRMSCLEFTKYVSWGQFVDKIKSGELKLVKSAYHREISSSQCIHVGSPANPFGEPGRELMSVRSGLHVSHEKLLVEKTMWERRFQHSLDFIMIGQEDTCVALLHNLETSVLEYVKAAKEHKLIMHKEQRDYAAWLEKEGYEHDYSELTNSYY